MKNIVVGVAGKDHASKSLAAYLNSKGITALRMNDIQQVEQFLHLLDVAIISSEAGFEGLTNLVRERSLIPIVELVKDRVTEMQVPSQTRVWRKLQVEQVTELAAFAINAAEEAIQSIEVLVVDDEPAVLNIIASFLRNTGYKVTTAGSSEETAGISNFAVFDVIVADLLGAQGMSQLLTERDQRGRIVIYTGTFLDSPAPKHVEDVIFDKAMNTDMVSPTVLRLARRP